LPVKHLVSEEPHLQRINRFTRSRPSAAEISPRREASYSADSCCERTSVGATAIDPVVIMGIVLMLVTPYGRRVAVRDETALLRR
jgi:hypothetical protein